MHTFHEKCIERWNKGTCPICRKIYKQNIITHNERVRHGNLADIGISDDEIQYIYSTIREITTKIYNFMFSRNRR